jgi:hypothetical protein
VNLTSEKHVKPLRFDGVQLITLSQIAPGAAHVLIGCCSCLAFPYTGGTFFVLVLLWSSHFWGFLFHGFFKTSSKTVYSNALAIALKASVRTTVFLFSGFTLKK